MPRKKHWSKLLEESGVRVRMYERANTDVLWLSYQEAGTKRRRSLQTIDRGEAERRARLVAKEIARVRLTGEHSTDDITLGQLFAYYEAHKLPTLKAGWAKAARTKVRIFTEAWGADRRVADIDQPLVDTYVAARRAGTIAPDRGGRWKAETRGVRDGAINEDLQWLSSVLNFGLSKRVHGRPLLRDNPLRALDWPKERQPRRPVATHERYVATMAHVDSVDPMGRLRCILTLARHTGRRESAICQLRVSDLLLGEERVRAALAAAGLNEATRDSSGAPLYPYGAIFWSPETDKMKLLHITPIDAGARAEIDLYLRRTARLGDAVLFPSPENEARPIRRDLAARWLLKAEALAGVPKLRGGVWHPLRRLWASERAHLSDVAVAAAGGWSDTQALKMSYQKATPADVLRAVQVGR